MCAMGHWRKGVMIEEFRDNATYMKQIGMGQKSAGRIRND